MQSLWNDRDAATYEGVLGQRVYFSRLLGSDSSLVLHGGGNTSVKVRERDLFGKLEDVLYVKGSGRDLATIELDGFSPVRMEPLLALARMPELTDLEMARQLRVAMTNPAAPSPSVEAILHALLPYQFVDHTHADAIITLTNTKRGAEHVRAALGEEVLILPYVMPGFELARQCAEALPELRASKATGIVLLHHGLFTFGETARESYERTIELVDRAERYLAGHGAWQLSKAPISAPSPSETTLAVARLRSAVSRALGAPAILTVSQDESTMHFVRRDDLSRVALQGPATPDHVIRTKRIPLIGGDVETYAEEYKEYFARFSGTVDRVITMLDPAPRVILDPGIGMVTVGRSVKEASIASDIYRHTVNIIERAERLDEYSALPPRDIFDVEYWDLEQAKLRQGGSPPPLTGGIALVTGAASGIGRATVDCLVAAGAAVIALDIDPKVAEICDRAEVYSAQCDVTDETSVRRAIEAGVLRYGGLDMLVLNAGIFPGGTQIADLGADRWRRVLSVNLDANVALMRLAHPLLKVAPGGGRVVVIGSKNVSAPGPGAAAYSASKAALTQLARVAALEWGSDGIRVNVVHPNAVFDTGIWTPDVLEARARSYGLTVEAYKRNNVLGVEVSSQDVAALITALCGPVFAKITGAQVPIDGGNERVI